MSIAQTLPPVEGGGGAGARFAQGFAALTLGMNSVGTFWIFCLTFLVCADVVGRYVFSAPIRGAAEMVGYSIVTAVFLQFANTLHVGRFTRADVLILRLEMTRPAGAFAVDAAFNLLGAARLSIVRRGHYP